MDALIKKHLPVHYYIHINSHFINIIIYSLSSRIIATFHQRLNPRKINHTKQVVDPPKKVLSFQGKLILGIQSRKDKRIN